MRAPWSVLIGLSLCASPVAAQQGDRGVFAIQRGETPLGREEFTFQPSAEGAAKGGVLASLARYPATAPTVQIQAMLEQGAAGAVVILQIDTRQASGVSRVYGAALKDNLTIRQTTSTAESVREYPRAAGIVILDDSVFALYQVVAERATAAGARLPVLFARSGRRGQLTATRSNPTTVELSGVVSGSLTVDAAGRLMRVVLADGVSAIRQSK
jgi:hypothetical protein